MRIVMAVLALLASSAPVAAQEAAATHKMSAGATVVGVFPQGDADETADTSLAVRPQFVYWFHPMVGLVASFDWVFVSEKDGAADTIYYDLSAGVRVTSRSGARARPFGEFQLGRHTVAVDDADYEESGIGFRMGGGGTYELGDALQGIAEVTYSSVSIDGFGGFGSVDIDAFALEVGVLARF
jgi:hypothetical protein